MQSEAQRLLRRAGGNNTALSITDGNNGGCRLRAAAGRAHLFSGARDDAPTSLPPAASLPARGWPGGSCIIFSASFFSRVRDWSHSPALRAGTVANLK